MQIASINNNTNFKALQVSKQSLEAMGTTHKALLKNPKIKKAAENCEVFVKPSTNTYKYKKFSLEKWFTGTLIATEITIFCLPLCVINPIISISATMFSMLMSCIFTGLYVLDKEVTHNKMLVQAGDKFENDKLTGNMTQQYEIDKNNTFLPDLTEELQQKRMQAKINK